MELRILGSLQVTDGERSVELRRPKPRALLAVLLLHPNQGLSTDRLVEALWADTPPRSATNTLQGYVSWLRHALAPLRGAPLVRTQTPGYVLTVDPEQIDAHRFERLVGEGIDARADGEPERAADVLGQALAMWRGPALADFAYDRFADVHAARLEELRLCAMEEHAQAELALGRHARLPSRLQALVEDNPLREPLWGLLMLALYRCGRQAEALRAFQAAKRVLGEELGIGPCPALCRLEAEVLAQAPSLDWTAVRSPPTPQSRGGCRARAGCRSGRSGTTSRSGLSSPSPSDAHRQAAARRCQEALLAGEPRVGRTRTAGQAAQPARREPDDVAGYERFVEAPGSVQDASHPTGSQSHKADPPPTAAVDAGDGHQACDVVRLPARGAPARRGRHVMAARARPPPPAGCSCSTPAPGES